MKLQNMDDRSAGPQHLSTFNAKVFIDGLSRAIDGGPLIFLDSEEVHIPACGFGQCYVVLSGCVEDWHTSEVGRYTIGQVYHRGHIILPERMLQSGWDDLSRVSIGRTAIGSMPTDALLKLLHDEPTLSRMLLEQSFSALGYALTRLVDANLVTVLERVRRELLRRVRATGDGVDRQIEIRSHEQFAAFLGANRETVSRELSFLAKEGAIAISRGYVTVVDAHLLANVGKAGS